MFGFFAGIYYWFPKVTGRMLNEAIGKLNFWLMFIGMNLAFFPMHFTGMDGMPRRIYTYDAEKGNLHPVQTVSTLPSGYDGHNSCSQIQITPNGKFLYAPNRGHNSIACFRVNPNNGYLAPIGQTPTEAVPRAFSIDPQGSFVYAAGLETGKLASYRIDQESGELNAGDVYDVGKGPMWVLITELV